MFYHGFGYGPHIGFFGGGASFIVMFIIFMVVMSLLRRSFYSSYRGYRGYRRYGRPYQGPYQRPYQPFDPNAYTGNPNRQADAGADKEQPTQFNQGSPGYGSAYGSNPVPHQDSAGAKTVYTGDNLSSGANSGAPTQRVDPTPGNNGEPTKPLT